MASCWQVRRNSKKAKKQLVFQGFLVLRPSNFEAKLTKKRPQTDQKSNKKLVSILIQFLMHLGGQVGSQDPPKIDKKSIKNGHQDHSYFLNPSWSQSGTILVQLLGHLDPTWPNLVPTWSQLGPNMAPKCPLVQGMRTHFSIQDAIKFFWNSGNPPKSLLDPPRADFR